MSSEADGQALYRCIYALEPQSGLFTIEQARKVGGGCDAFFFTSIIWPADGGLSMRSFSFDGRSGGGDLTPNDLFRVFMSLANQLQESLAEGSWNQRIARATWESISISFQRMRDGEFENHVEEDEDDEV